jgi:hypothetical protein
VSRNLHLLLAAVALVAEGLDLTVNREKPVTVLMDTQRPTVPRRVAFISHL